MQATSCALARNEMRVRADGAKFFPALSAGEIGVRGRFGDEHSARGEIVEFVPPALIARQRWYSVTRNFSAENAREVASCSCGGEFVIERNQHAAAEKNRVGGDQPLGLIGHDDGGACAVLQARVLQRARERQRVLFELAIGEARVFAFAVGFDQADFVVAIGPARRAALRRANCIGGDPALQA